MVAGRAAELTDRVQELRPAPSPFELFCGEWAHPLVYPLPTKRVWPSGGVLVASAMAWEGAKLVRGVASRPDFLEKDGLVKKLPRARVRVAFAGHE